MTSGVPESWEALLDTNTRNSREQAQRVRATVVGKRAGLHLVGEGIYLNEDSLHGALKRLTSQDKL